MRVERSEVEVSHLQFADDTIIFCPANKQVIINYRRIMECFGIISGLHINYTKSAIIPICCQRFWANDNSR